MPSLVDAVFQITVTDPESFGEQGYKSRRRWTPGAGANGTRQQVTLTASAFTALSPPSGSKAVVLILGTATSLTLKGLTSDTGVKLTPASAALGIDVIIPLGTSPSIGIANGLGSDQIIEAIFL